MNWLKLPIDQRPKLVCLYFNEPDHAGHVYGADSKEVNEQIVISDQIVYSNLDWYIDLHPFITQIDNQLLEFEKAYSSI